MSFFIPSLLPFPFNQKDIILNFQKIEDFPIFHRDSMMYCKGKKGNGAARLLHAAWGKGGSLRSERRWVPIETTDISTMVNPSTSITGHDETNVLLVLSFSLHVFFRSFFLPYGFSIFSSLMCGYAKITQKLLKLFQGLHACLKKHRNIPFKG